MTTAWIFPGIDALIRPRRAAATLAIPAVRAAVAQTAELTALR